MKKILLGTTALVSLFAASAMAATPEVMIKGKVETFVAMTSQKSAWKNTHINAAGEHKFHSYNNKNMSMHNKAKVIVSVKGKADSGMMYGAVAKIQPTASKASTFSDGKHGRTYLWLESSMGRLEAGSNWAVSKSMKVDAGSIAHATGGASNGYWDDRVGHAGSDLLILQGDTLFNRSAAHSSGESSRKISWFSPRYNGVQLGISYAPDASNTGSGLTDDGSILEVHKLMKNLWSLGLNYSNNFNKMNFTFGAVADFGKATLAKKSGSVDSSKNKLKSYEAGFALGSGNMSFAASYGTDGKSLQDKGTSAVSKWWTAGAAYEQGPMGASLTYFHSKKGTSSSSYKVKCISVGADYQMAAGLMPYAEVNFFNITPGATATIKDKNKGTVFIVGTSVSF